jgi:transcriptional regulator with XRE-family HTH domain
MPAPLWVQVRDPAKLASAIAASGLTQTDVAEASGITQARVSQLCAHSMVPRRVAAKTALAILGVISEHREDLFVGWTPHLTRHPDSTPGPTPEPGDL